MIAPQGRYEFIETLGTGATSRVDKARDTLIGRTVALKTFLHGFGSGDVQKQFLREAQIVGRLAHPFIVGLYDVGTDPNGVPFFVMEYVEGKTLEKILDAGPLPLEKAAVWAADLTAAIARAHRAKVIHGDIKPANILVTKEGQVKLGDFGIARFATQVSSSGSLMGTPAYLSPEQIQGQTQDTRSDLFSLGIILYQMTTGVRPFNGSSVSAVCAQIVAITPPPPSHHNPSLPAAFDRIVMRCLAKDPADRYATAEALGASLYPFAHGTEMAPAIPAANATLPASELAKQVKLWAGAALKSASATVASGSKSFASLTEELSRRFALAAVTLWNSKENWFHRPIQRKDLWAAGSAAVMLLSLVPIARALRNHSHAQPYMVAAASVSSGPSALVSSAPDPAITSNASMINVSSSQVANTSTVTVDTPDNAPSNQRTITARGAERRGVSTSKLSARAATAKQSTPVSTNLPLYGPEILPSLPMDITPAKTVTIRKATLHIDIVSQANDQFVSVYSGKELLITTPLHPAHPGDKLQFNCSVNAGPHALKVVLYRNDKTELLHQENTSELHADGANTLQIHVNRHAKMLVKHESSLDVVWPTKAPGSAAVTTQDFKPAGALAMR